MIPRRRALLALVLLAFAAPACDRYHVVSEGASP